MTSVKMILSLLRRTRLYIAWKKEDLDTVMTPEMERKYWKSAAKDRMKLLRSDARFVGTGGRHTGTMPPVILSYTPALPPEKPRKINRYEDYFITPKTYCKWHRMVYPGTKHPTIAEASRLRATHDPEELRQIHHISRMLPDDQVFPDADGVPKPWSSKYQKKWRKWLKSRENDVIFVDEDLETPHLSHKIQPEIKNFSPRRRRILNTIH
ncbi:hypothetical protein JR316_0005389 [Psilocybe cubensis]|uniref:Uncharacterized protein n=2 Tax=Psilocybe cubensis TaxID=181762 RepID=A0ACB8H666_PSICU|nr:hypothetical protein JR316_0005389 [Psilocybe cubensis]KAH9483283.1 hypothetical protein JR316_0005389 [Psilocybe cubensis]